MKRFLIVATRAVVSVLLGGVFDTGSMAVATLKKNLHDINDGVIADAPEWQCVNQE